MSLIKISAVFFLLFFADSRWLLKHKFNLANVYGSKTKSKITTFSTEAQRIEDYYSRLRPDIIERIYKLYENDMLLFGYTFVTSRIDAGGFFN